MKKISKLGVIALFTLAAVVSCNKAEIKLDNDDLSVQMAKQTGIKSAFTGDLEVMIRNPEDQQDEAVNIASMAIMEALVPYFKNPSFRVEVINLAQTRNYHWVSIDELFQSGLIEQTEFYDNLVKSEYYNGADPQLWIQESFDNVVQHFPVINIANITLANALNNEYFLSIGLESNTDFTTDNNGLALVYEYHGEVLFELAVMNEEYGTSSLAPIFVICPATDPQNPPVIPGFSTSITNGGFGDSTLYVAPLNKTSGMQSFDSRPICLFEQKIKKRFERFGKSEIASVGFWDVNPIYGGNTNPYAFFNDQNGGNMWSLKKQDLNTTQYVWNKLHVQGEWLFPFNSHFVWNSYEYDWLMASQVLCKLYDLNDPNASTNVHMAFGLRKYYHEVYAYDPSQNGPSAASTYNLSLHHPQLWSTVWVTSPNGEFRVWRVQP